MLDAIPFPWFGNNISYTMHGFIDDATGKITGLYICKNKYLPGYLEILSDRAFRRVGAEDGGKGGAGADPLYGADLPPEPVLRS